MSISKGLVPEFVLSLRGYTWPYFIKDLSAGIIVGVVALPLAIAFGIASGVSPTEGLITAIIGGFIVSLLGGSKVQIGGPTGAFIVIVYGIIQQYGLDGLAIATIMAGLLLMLLGFLRLGSLVRFIPYPIIVGFTAGIAVTIFTTQIADLFGLQIDSMPGDFIGKWRVIIEYLPMGSWLPFIFALSTIVIIRLLPKVNQKIPSTLVALVLLTLASYGMQWLGYMRPETIGDNYVIERALPSFSLPEVSLDRIVVLFPSALTIMLLGAMESLLSASVADGVIGTKHNPDSELIAQGVANVVVPFFGGIPVTGAIARTMTNINSGGRTPVAGITHAVVLLLILLLLSPLTAHIPMAVLAGVLVVVSYNMSGWRSFISIFKGPRGDTVILLVTFSLTVLTDLTIAIGVGMLLAIALLFRRILNVSSIERIAIGEITDEPLYDEDEDLPEGVEVYEVEGPFFFGIANKFEEVMVTVHDQPLVRIIRMRRVPFIDSTGLYNLKMVLQRHRKRGIQVVLSGVRPSVYAHLEQTGIIDLLGRENILPTFAEAQIRARALLGIV
jgi:high affinity sulphate transporter 1